MAVNVIDLVQKHINGPLTRQIASALAESEAKTQSAVAMAVPAITGALMKQAQTPAGADSLASLLDRTDTGLLANLTSALGSGAKGLMETGSTLTSGLFGPQLNAVSDGLSRASGMGKEKVVSLLALLAPVVMGVLAKVKREQGLDAAGLSNLLSSQSTFLSGLLPAGLGDTLGIGSMLSSGTKVRAGAERPGAKAAGAGRAAARTAERATERAVPEASSLLRKLLPIAVLAVIVLVAWGWWTGRDSSPVEAARPLQGVVGEAQTDLKNHVDTAATALRGVTDVESARAALPRLQTATQGIAALTPTLTGLPTETRSSLASAAAAAIKSLQPLADQALAVPGAEEVLGPAVIGLMDALAKLR